MMCILLDVPRNLDDLSFHRVPALADDEYPVEEIQTNRVTDEDTAGNSR